MKSERVQISEDLASSSQKISLYLEVPAQDTCACLRSPGSRQDAQIESEDVECSRGHVPEDLPCATPGQRLRHLVMSEEQMLSAPQV